MELWLRAFRICATVGAVTACSGGISYRGGGNGRQHRVSVVAALNTEVCGQIVTTVRSSACWWASRSNDSLPLMCCGNEKGGSAAELGSELALTNHVASLLKVHHIWPVHARELGLGNEFISCCDASAPNCTGPEGYWVNGPRREAAKQTFFTFLKWNYFWMKMEFEGLFF